MSNYAHFVNPFPDHWEPLRQPRQMAPRILIVYFSPKTQLDSALHSPPISENLDALGENDYSKIDLPTP